MSLSVYLSTPRWISYDKGVTLTREDEHVYDANITHNLGTMAQEAGIYYALWRPYMLGVDNPEWATHQEEDEYEENTEVLAGEIIDIVERGLADMKARPDHYRQFDSPNGWGTYDNFVPWVERYLAALKEFPNAIITVSR